MLVALVIGVLAVQAPAGPATEGPTQTPGLAIVDQRPSEPLEDLTPSRDEGEALVVPVQDDVVPRTPEPEVRGAALARAAAADIRDLLRFTRNRRVESRLSHESMGGATARVLDLGTSLRVNDRWTVGASGQRQWKFGRVDSRAGAGAAWSATPALELRAQTHVGTGNEVLPTVESAGHARWSVGRADIAAGVRHLRFQAPETSVWVWAPELTLWVSDGLAVSTRHSRRSSDYQGLSSSIVDHTTLVRTHAHVHRAVWLDLGYADGIEAFGDGSPDRGGLFSARTVLAGARVDLRRLAALEITTEYQWRTTGLTTFQVSAAIAYGF